MKQNKIEKATVIFKNENEEKSIIVNITYDEKAENIGVQLKAEPKEKISDVFERLSAILIDELGEIEQ